MTQDAVWQLDGQLLDVLTELGVELEWVEAGAYVLTLRGIRRRSTLVWLVAGEQAVAVEAFVMHVVPTDCPDPGRLHRHLLARNLRLRAVHYGLDEVGDVFLTGSLPHSAVTVEGVDRLLGELWQLVDDDHDSLVVLAYGDRLVADGALAHKVLADGAGRRPAGTPDWAPQRDVRR